MAKSPSTIKGKKGFRVFLLSYLNHHRNIPFDAKTLYALFGKYGYKQNYIARDISNLRNINYISATDVWGVFKFNSDNMKKIKFTNPELAKQISEKIYPKDEKWAV